MDTAAIPQVPRTVLLLSRTAWDMGTAMGTVVDIAGAACHTTVAVVAVVVVEAVPFTKEDNLFPVVEELQKVAAIIKLGTTTFRGSE